MEREKGSLCLRQHSYMQTRRAFATLSPLLQNIPAQMTWVTQGQRVPEAVWLTCSLVTVPGFAVCFLLSQPVRAVGMQNGKFLVFTRLCCAIPHMWYIYLLELVYV